MLWNSVGFDIADRYDGTSVEDDEDDEHATFPSV